MSTKIVLLLLALLLVPSGAALGGDAPGTGSVAGSGKDARAGEYKTVKPGELQRQSAAPLLVLISYSAIWLLLLLFVVALWRRISRAERELAELRALATGPKEER